MKHIDRYTPPAPEDLLALKTDLGATSQEMAKLAGLTQGSQWRKYTGTAEPRPMNKHMHFYMASLLTLSDADIERVTAAMKAHGAKVGTAPLPLGSSPPVEDVRSLNLDLFGDEAS
jgi:hypothetical protein